MALDAQRQQQKGDDPPVQGAIRFQGGKGDAGEV